MIKIALVDDHKVFLEGLASLLKRAEDFDVVATFSNGIDLMRHLAKGELPDVVLLDIEMGRVSGVEVAENLLQQYPEVKVMMLSSYFNEEFVDQLMESGISGYLLKSTGFTELQAGIRQVAAGSFAFSPEVMELIVKGYKSASAPKEEGVEDKQLSERELELIRLIADEYTMREIAEKIYLSEHTVKTHRKNIMAKLDVKNTAGLVKKAFILGFIDA